MSETIQSERPATGIRWNLSDVLPATSGKIFQSAVLEPLESMIVEFENSRPDLYESISVERFSKFLKDYESISRLMSKLGSFAYMYFSQDTKSQDARAFKSRVEEIEAEAANRILFFELWWKSLDERKSSELVASSRD